MNVNILRKFRDQCLSRVNVSQRFRSVRNSHYISMVLLGLCMSLVCVGLSDLALFGTSQK